MLEHGARSLARKTESVASCAPAAARRRGRDVGLNGLLVERDQEVDALRRALGDAAAGFGGVTLIDAPPGMGKSRLLSVAGDVARSAGFEVLGARATELERDFPFGVLIQLLEPLWAAATPQARERLLSAGARPAGELLEGCAPRELTSTAADEPYPLIHSLFCLVRNLSTSADGVTQPLLVLVDDVHWADRASMRFLAYAAERLRELPIAILLGVRSAEESADPAALSALRIAAGSAVLRPQPLSEVGVATITRSRLPEASGVFIVACARLSAGNPFLLVSLLEEVAREGHRPDAAMARRLDELAPESVLHSLVAGLRCLPPEAGAVARAVAVLGDGSAIGHVAALAGISPAHAVAAADALAGMHVLHPGSPLSVVHPMVTAAIRASMSPLERALMHRRAASILLEAGMPVEAVAAQLLNASVEADPRAVEALRTAAGNALAGGQPETAARMLERALSEESHPAQRVEIMGELAEAEAAARLPAAVERLEYALELTSDSERRARLTLTLGQILIEQHRFEQAAEVLLASDRAEMTGPLADEFDALLLATARVVPKIRRHANDRGRSLAARVSGEPTPAQRWALAEVALNAALTGEPRDRVTERVRRAWCGSSALGNEEASTVRLLTVALLVVDELELSLDLCRAAAKGADPASAIAIAARNCRVWPLYERGDVALALADAEATLSAQPEDWSRLPHMGTNYAALALCQIQRGELERAETALSILDHPGVHESLHHPHLLDARARLRLAQIRPADALTDAMQAGQLAEEFAMTSPGSVQWRTTAALAQLALGNRRQAGLLAAEERERAEEVGATRVLIRALRCLGLAERGRHRVETLARAAGLGLGGPPRLEHIEALLAYGGALRRANRRAAAREPLQRALELARLGGAAHLAATARTELSATGVRARRALLSGVESLTASELRVAQLAASGRTTREMAEALFVTRKTIEYHLRQIYRKLDIGSRDQLPGALGILAGDA